MGQAKQRGSYEQRAQLAIEKNRLAQLEQDRITAEKDRLLEEKRQREHEAFLMLPETERDAVRENNRLVRNRASHAGLALSAAMLTLPTPETIAKRRE